MKSQMHGVFPESEDEETNEIILYDFFQFVLKMRNVLIVFVIDL